MAAKRNRWAWVAAGAVAATLPSLALAQFPGAGGAAAGGGSTATTVTTATTAAGQVPAPKNIWSFFCMTEEQHAKCKEKLCKCKLVQLGGNFLKPVNALSGGLLPDCCPPGPSAADLAKPADSAEGAAARIQKEEAEAKARRLAIRYLGTVDCSYFPEAEAALILGLRADTNECVRFEAALALNRGCCCTKKIVAALKISAEGSDKDKNPAEKSDRVRFAALAALNRCLSNCNTPPDANEQPEKPQKLDAPERPAEKVAQADAMLPAYYVKLKGPLDRALYDEARELIARMPSPPPAATGLFTMVPPLPGAPPRTEDPTTLYGVLVQTMHAPPPLTPEPPVAAGVTPVGAFVPADGLGSGIPVSRSQKVQSIPVTP